MTEETDRTADRGVELRAAALDLVAAIDAALAEVAMLEGRLECLAGRNCTGIELWRDADSDSPKLYVTHSTNATCPIHGRPAPGKRLRTYIGTKPEQQKRAQAAMHAEALRRAYEQRLAEIESALAMGYRLEQIVDALRGDS